MNNKGLIVNVFRKSHVAPPADNFERFLHSTDTTNDGITSRFDTFVLLSDKADHQVFAATDKRPALRVVKRTFGSGVYVHAEPLNGPGGKKMVGPMDGGNFIYSSDSRYKEITGVEYPIPVHDRWDTPEDYDALSR